MIHPTRPPSTSGLTKGLRSLYSIYFKVDTTINSGNFIKILFPNYTALDPGTC